MVHQNEKQVVWLHGVVKSPPFSVEARFEAGYLLGMLQQGELLSMPASRPMPSIGSRCHELRVRDESSAWRIVYRLDADAVIVLDVFRKTTQQTPLSVIRACRERLRRYDADSKECP